MRKAAGYPSAPPFSVSFFFLSLLLPLPLSSLLLPLHFSFLLLPLPFSSLLLLLPFSSLLLPLPFSSLLLPLHFSFLLLPLHFSFLLLSLSSLFDLSSRDPHVLPILYPPCSSRLLQQRGQQAAELLPDPDPQAPVGIAFPCDLPAVGEVL